jgi:hypothetical protein
MTAPDRMPEAFENSLHDAGHPHKEPPANPGRFIEGLLLVLKSLPLIVGCLPCEVEHHLPSPIPPKLGGAVKRECGGEPQRSPTSRRKAVHAVSRASITPERVAV